jgi:hypothetical protein
MWLISKQLNEDANFANKVNCVDTLKDNVKNTAIIALPEGVRARRHSTRYDDLTVAAEGDEATLCGDDYDSVLGTADWNDAGMYVSTYVVLYICIYIYICMYRSYAWYVYVCMYVCMCIYIYTHTYI